VNQNTAEINQKIQQQSNLITKYDQTKSDFIKSYKVLKKTASYLKKITKQFEAIQKDVERERLGKYSEVTASDTNQANDLINEAGEIMRKASDLKSLAESPDVQTVSQYPVAIKGDGVPFRINPKALSGLLGAGQAAPDLETDTALAPPKEDDDGWY